jgi:hypothetical protein
LTRAAFNHEKALRGLLGEVRSALGGGRVEEAGNRRLGPMLDLLDLELGTAIDVLNDAEGPPHQGALSVLDGVRGRLGLIRLLDAFDPDADPRGWAMDALDCGDEQSDPGGAP